MLFLVKSSLWNRLSPVQNHPSYFYLFKKLSDRVLSSDEFVLQTGVLFFTQCFSYVTKKRIDETMWKMLPKQLRKVEKIKPLPSYDSVKVTSTFHHVPKSSNPNILRRESTLAAVLLRELQETVDSGQIGKEVEELRVDFTSVSMRGKYACTVTWKSQGMALDKVIYDTLTKHAATIRHVIMHSLVIGVIPKFTFAIDPGVEEQHKIKEVFYSGNLDMGDMTVNESTSCADSKPERKKKTSQVQSTDPTYELFQINRDSLRNKILRSKLSKSENSANEENR